MATRKTIPKETLLKLWVLSGGRCEFPGCNKFLLQEGMTFKPDNFAHVAHNIAASPDGPRGNKQLSPELQTDYDNLLLLCFDHSKLVDGRNAGDYSVEQLKDYKVKHEERIRIQTSVGPELATTVFRFQSPICERRSEIQIAEAYAALHPRHPSSEKGVHLDFSRKAGSGDEAFWLEFAREISDEVKTALRTGNDGQRYDHVSVFALGPIPALIHLGNQVGNVVPVEVFQKHRDTNDWKWKPEPTEDAFEFQLTKNEAPPANAVALVLSLSGKITPSEYIRVIGEAPTYEISIETPSPEFLKHKSRLEKFRILFRKTVDEIRAVHGGECTIHLFPAIPAPVAVLCGKELLPKSDPTILIYDNDRAKGGFVPTLTIK